MSGVQATGNGRQISAASPLLRDADTDWFALGREEDSLPAGAPGWTERNIRSLLAAASLIFPECGFAVTTFDPATDLQIKIVCSEGANAAIAEFLACLKWRPEWQAGLLPEGGAIEFPGGFRDLAESLDEKMHVPSRIHHLLLFAVPNHMRTALMVWTPDEYGPFRAPEIGPLREKAQSIASVIRLGEQLAASSMSELGTSFDRLNFGFVIVDHAMRLVRANDTAQAMLDQGECMRADDKMLKLPDPMSDSRLRQLLSHIATLPKRSPDATGVVAMRSANGDGLIRCIASVLRDSEDSLLGPPLFGLTICAQNRPGAMSVPELRRLGFSPAEAELVADLLKGLTVSQHAGERGIAVATARAHLKRAMMRVGVHRQADLIRQIVRIS